MDYCVEAALPYICNPKPLQLASYALVALVHFLALWTHHVFVWNSRFNCTGSGCPEISLIRMIAECAVLEILLIMLLTSYWRCILTAAGSYAPSFDEPLQPNPSQSSHTVINIQPTPADARGTSVLEGRNRGRTLWCRKCDKEKPPRAHHCSMCNACFLRMDHHCPWVVGCVGYRNHKYFLNFLVYSSAVLAYATVLQHAIPMLREPGKDVLICSASVVVNYASIAVLLGSVASFACFHVFISARNVTTIELMDHLNGRGIINHFRVNCYDMGWRQNLKQLLGQREWTWLLPFYPWTLFAEGDGGGATFPNRYNSTVLEYQYAALDANVDDAQ